MGVASRPANADTLTLLHSFSVAGGSGAVGGLTPDGSGGFYGQTISGGSACVAPGRREARYKPGCGVIYHFDKSGHYTVLFRFTGEDGAYGISKLSLAGDYLIGTTLSGTSGHRGRVFTIKTDGTGFAILHRFDGADGLFPRTAPVQGPDGALYGIAEDGGIGVTPPFDQTGNGVFYRLSMSGSYQVLHYFTGADDGCNPVSIIISPESIIYGSTVLCGRQGGGVIWSYRLATGRFEILHSFLGLDYKPNGWGPLLGGIAADGTLYGVTEFGGVTNDGAIFSAKAGENGLAVQTVAYFPPYYTPIAPPSVSAEGVLTGLTYATLYRYEKGVITTLYTFPLDPGSTLPNGFLNTPVVSDSGVIFGASIQGGYNRCRNADFAEVTGCGTIWAFTP